MYQVHAQQFLKSKDLSCDLNFECTFHFFLKEVFINYNCYFELIGDDNSNIFFNKFAFKWISLKKKLKKDSCGYAKSS